MTALLQAASVLAIALALPPASAQTIFQPATEAASKETKIYSSVPSSNFASNLNVTSLDTGAHFLALVQFDLTQLGSAESIASAMFTLYSTGVGASGAGAIGGAVTLRPILNAWREDAAGPLSAPLATYDAFFGPAPTLGFGPAIATQTVSSAGFYTWEITSTVKAWQAGSLPNYGLLIELSSAGGDIGFADVDSNPAIEGSAPSLLIVPEPATVPLLFGAGILLMQGRRRGALARQKSL